MPGTSGAWAVGAGLGVAINAAGALGALSCGLVLFVLVFYGLQRKSQALRLLLNVALANIGSV